MHYLIPIKNDLFNIANRILAVCANYKVFFNAKTRKYEVHNFAQRPNTLAFVVPYNALDARTVQFARYTHVNNVKKLLSDMEKNNAQYLKNVDKSIGELTEGRIENIRNSPTV